MLNGLLDRVIYMRNNIAVIYIVLICALTVCAISVAKRS